jgi:NAD-dependent dihydropyrimidine dehydrogenase PreA subunit
MAYIVTINIETCEGCGDCAENCPVEILSLDARPADVSAPETAEDPEKVAIVSGDAAECTGCMACVSVCPSESMSVQEI